MTTTATEQTPYEKAQEILDREVKIVRYTIAGHEKHLDALALIIEIFRNDLVVFFGLESSYAVAVITTEDINGTLESIHHRMRRAGWKPSSPFNKERLSWHWRENGTLEDSPVIRFALLLADNATCRKVQVGTREVPVWEIQCEKGEIEEPGNE